MAFQKGYVPWNKGLKGIKTSNKGMNAWDKGKQINKADYPNWGMSNKKHSEETKRHLSDAHKEKKHTEETKEKIRIKLKGHKNYLLKQSPETRLKISKGMTGINKGRKLGFIPKFAFKKGHRPWNWKGGNSLQKAIRDLIQYKEWRIKVYERDYWTCKGCNTKGNPIEAHHIKDFSKILREYNIKTIEEAMSCKELWDVNNGVTLCEGCHDLTKTGRGDKK